MKLGIIRSVAIGVVFLLTGVYPSGQGATQVFVDGRELDCSIRYGDIVNPLEIASFFVRPGEVVLLEIEGRHQARRHDLRIDGGTVGRIENGWGWTAPEEAGVFSGELSHAHSTTTTVVNFLVMVPFQDLETEELNGYLVGRYPEVPPRGRQSFYSPPPGFIQVTRENQNTLIAPNFTLRQFLCKQESGYPKYVVLEERLLIALERILEEVNDRGYPADTLFVMSGYRTPAYNRAIGNVPNSRHVFGDAADIFVDQKPADGVMDDLNRDGEIGPEDSDILARIVEESLGNIALEGGLGKYPANAVHGPFVHVDLRGYQARW